jgi:mannose-6-phosphate isomerase-like protein (cupin superfamily)
MLKTSFCLECKKEFGHYSERKYCSVDCSNSAISRLRIGENNPSFIKKKEKSICVNCEKEFTYNEGEKRIFCSLFCSKEINTNNSLTYPRELRKQLIKDKNKCIMCGSEKHLKMHHINYDKKDYSHSNLVTLCKKCRKITRCEKVFWEQLFTALNSCCKVVKKGWGLEVHYCNNEKYCLKNLIFFKGKKFSLHSHKLKSELWLVSWGEFECFIQKDKESDFFILKKGETILLEPTVEHQIQAKRNSIITEVSTTDFPEDSYRTEKGD